LYDFNAENIGDIVTSNLLNYGDPIGVKNIVSDIDSILIDGSYHRQLKFTTITGDPTGEIWTEGIGSNFGLIYPRFYLVTDNSYDLRCFTTETISYQNNQLLLGYCQSIPPVNCEFATTIENVSKPLHLFAFPNPATDYLHIHLTARCTSAVISLYSAVGVKVNEIEVEDSDLGLGISSLSPGIYVLQLDADGLRERIMVIKQ
jgi:hypothetical protein